MNPSHKRRGFFLVGRELHGRADADTTARPRGRHRPNHLICFNLFSLHVVDVQHELLVAYTVTKGLCSDVKEGHVLLDELAKRHPEMLKKKRS